MKPSNLRTSFLVPRRIVDADGQHCNKEKAKPLCFSDAPQLMLEKVFIKSPLVLYFAAGFS